MLVPKEKMVVCLPLLPVSTQWLPPDFWGWWDVRVLGVPMPVSPGTLANHMPAAVRPS